MSIRMRQEVERKILTQFVKDALAAGKRLSVSLERGYDVDEMLLGSRDEAEIIEQATAGDDCHVFVHAAVGPLLDGGETLISEGWVYFVWGNDGYDCMSDCTTNLEDNGLLTKANEIANQYAD